MSCPRILLCDDSNVILRLLEKRLTDAAYDIVGKARDGIECLELYLATKPNLVLLDITMPNMDGRACLTDLVKMDPKARVIMISAVMDSVVQASCITDGAMAFINKSDLQSPNIFKDKVLPVIEKFAKAV